MERLIVDTDPGIDDAAALFFGFASPEVTIELITTVNDDLSVDYAGSSDLLHKIRNQMANTISRDGVNLVRRTATWEGANAAHRYRPG